MTASLYQCGWSSTTDSLILPLRRLTMRRVSQKIIEVLLPTQAMAHAKNLRRHTLGIQLNVVDRAVPEIARIRQKLMHLKRLLRIETQFFGCQFHPTGLGMMRIEIDDHDDDVI